MQMSHFEGSLNKGLSSLQKAKALSFVVFAVLLIVFIAWSCSEEVIEVSDDKDLIGAALSPGVNLVANPSFETNTAGWMGWQSTITREALSGAPNGGYVVKV